MEQVVKKIQQSLESIKVKETNDIDEIKVVLQSILFVPDNDIRTIVISELTKLISEMIEKS